MTLPTSDRPIRRHVLYIPGYATAGPASHRKLFAREAAQFGALWGVETVVAELEPLTADAPFARWRVTTQMATATVETTMEVLRWDDLVAFDFHTPLLSKVAHGLATLADQIVSGTLLRSARAAPWFAFAWIYPFLGLLACAGLGAAIGAGLGHIVGGGAGLAIGLIAGGLSAFAALAAVQRTPLFVVHLLDDWIAQRRYRRRADPALDGRLDAFSQRLRAVLAESGADEVLVVGHSSGSFLAIDAVARAYEAEPGLGREGPPLSLLTVGAAELLIGLHPGAGWFRDRLARLAGEGSLFWAEVVGRWDTLNFAERDPVTELRLDVPAERPNPRFRRVGLKRLLGPATIRRCKRRLDVFRIHFQYVMANELRGPYDFFSLVCGAPSVRDQFGRRPDEAMAPFPAAISSPLDLRGV